MKCSLFFIIIHVKIDIMKIQELLEYGRNNLIEKEEPYRLSKMLLKHLLKLDDHYLLIHNNEDVEEMVVVGYKQGIDRLQQGIPIQYITHQQEFMGIDFYVDENVLIPQPDTEVLIEEVINIGSRSNILDLCTGSGAIGVSIAKYLESSRVTMSDISKEALEIAKRNAVNNQVIDKCQFVLSNLFEEIEDKFDIIVSNPPYIQTAVIKTLSKEVQNEPMLALDGGQDGLAFYKTIANEAWKYLKQDGTLVLEIGYDQKEQVIKLLEQTEKYTEIASKKDLAGNDRIVMCRRK